MINSTVVILLNRTIVDLVNIDDIQYIFTFNMVYVRGHQLTSIDIRFETHQTAAVPNSFTDFYTR